MFYLRATIWHDGECLNWLLRGSLLLSIAAIHEGLDWSVAPSMTAGLHVLDYLAGWIAGFSPAGWRVAPLGYIA